MDVIERIKQQVNSLVGMTGGETSCIEAIHVPFVDLVELLILADKNDAAQRVPVTERLPANKVGKYGISELTVVLCTDGKEWYKAYYVRHHEVNCEDMGYEGDGEYDEETDSYYWPEGWYECSSENEDTDWALGAKITHWMPLPPLPGEGD